MKDLAEGEIVYVQGSAAKPYQLKREGDVYSCTCPAWLHQGLPIDQRTCKHLRAHRGEAAEAERVGGAGGTSAPRARSGGGGGGRAPAVKKEGAPPVLLAQTWANDRDLTGWWMSEKLDGMRAWWDGQRLLSRLGNEVLAPEWWIEGLPAEPLDGELWIARGAFQQTMSIVRSGGKGPRWKDVRYVLFDAPGRAAPFEERIAWLTERFPAGAHPYAQFHPHEHCEGVEHLRRELDRVEALGGEGLMLREPRSRYVAGRSHTLLKVKKFFDAEARVVGHQPGSGRHKGRMGALKVVLGDGTEFAIGTGFSDAERREPPPVGAVITFRYQELSKDGVPRFGSYVGVRADAAWPPDPASQPQPGQRAVLGGHGEEEEEREEEDGQGQGQGQGQGEEEEREEEDGQGQGQGQGQGEEEEGEEGERGRRRFVRPGVGWEIRLTGKQLEIRWGPTGKPPQRVVEEFASEAVAAVVAEALVREKLRQGFRER